ncbi:forkhead box protein P2-like isoform X2 [Phyllopteryx taeniolatus]|uniref:forkhead box protein P2-like isoform X2 n=1 Tax=Phyllopteryx taeniolatus TaxID=161469 RepID=UPI002AD45EAE|nr:forkhead box protein P2-like isoform X2 [Phyllopteryx taeniolatus]
MPESSRVARQNQEGGHLHSGGDDAAEVGGTVDSLYLKQVSLAMAAPRQVTRTLSSGQLQALMQHKQQALILHQHHLKEFYKKQEQINAQLLQQQPAKKSKELLAQQLALQQLLHIQQHLHFQHQQSVCSSAANISSVESKHVWKEMTTRAAEEEDENTKCDHNGADKKKTIDERQTRDLLSCCPQNCSSEADLTTINVLYGHGVCNWPGCESICQNYSKFVKHMRCEHTLDDRSAAQCRVQMQVVHQLEIQLLKERERLRAMTAHLQLTPTAESNSAPTGSHLTPRDTSVDPLCPQSSSVTCNSPSPSPPHLLAPVGAPLQEGPPRTTCAGAMRHRHHRLAYSSEKEHELYKNADIRPPFTYATLIRQAILESADTQLTLNEIYTWFTRTFAFFRRNAATWKNAVRHNLSLHRCFVRVENAKGGVWTVDEAEYQRRRSQKMAGSPLLMDFGSVLNASLQTTFTDAASLGFKCGNGKSLESPAQQCHLNMLHTHHRESVMGNNGGPQLDGTRINDKDLL